MSARVFAAVDIGASGGRVMAGSISDESITLESVRRFPNPLAMHGSELRWDLTALSNEVRQGLAEVQRLYPHVESVGLDTWAVDYGLLDADGRLLGEPVSYRDGRTSTVIDDVHAVVSPDELYAVNGLQFLPFTTLYQLAAEQRGPRWPKAAHVVLIPDLLAYWLTGELRSELTNASTTGLVDARSREWAGDLLTRLEIPPTMLPALESPGTVRGQVHDLAGIPLTTVASHDTASAVVAVPATSEHFAYISCGTWALVGLELDAPVLTEPARAANFTNEIGVDGRVRFLRNVGGLWLLQECMREWGRDDLEALLAEAAALADHGPIFDVNDPVFTSPGPMQQRIAAAATCRGERPPTNPAETVRSIVDSLAEAFARTVAEASVLARRTVDVIHLVGGGSRNEFLCRQTARASGLPVIAGPVEATALGNVVVQAQAWGAAPGSLEEIRAHIATTTPLRRYEPS